jgi:pyrroline-5-carboxylate reductase
MNLKVGFIGGGNMAEAFIAALVEGEALLPANVLVSDVNQERLKFLSETYGVRTTLSNVEVAVNSDVLFLAVKPQVLTSVLEEIKEAVSPAQVLVSMAAGYPISKVERVVGDDKKVVRIMPNIMVRLRKGVVAYCDNKRLLDEEREKVKALLSFTGKLFELPEGQFDAVTAVAGSSPAFFFLLLEAACDGAVRVGLSRETAKEMLLQVLSGVGAMAEKEHPEVLKDKVSSPAGTTVEGLFALEDRGARAALIEAVTAAYRRSREITELISGSDD